VPVPVPVPVPVLVLVLVPVSLNGCLPLPELRRAHRVRFGLYAGVPGRHEGSAVQFTVTETIGADRQAVLHSLVDPNYYAHLGEAATAVRAPQLLSVDQDGGTIRTSVRYAFDGTISGPAALVVDADKLTWVIETTYDTAAHTGTLVVVPDHYEGMLRCSGTLRLETGGPGETVETVSGRLVVRVPLVSAAAEKAILGGFTRHLELEAVTLAEYCAEHGQETLSNVVSGRNARSGAQLKDAVRAQDSPLSADSSGVGCRTGEVSRE
jgi:Protein of unknown function (DUF2505)